MISETLFLLRACSGALFVMFYSIWAAVVDLFSDGLFLSHTRDVQYVTKVMYIPALTCISRVALFIQSFPIVY